MPKEEGKPKELRQKSLEDFSEKVGAKETRKLKARGQKDRNIWFGLGLFGIVGWSVAIPTLLGTALGIWIDANYPSRFSWTLMLLFLGVGLGSWNTWSWVNRTGKNGW